MHNAGPSPNRINWLIIGEKINPWDKRTFENAGTIKATILDINIIIDQVLEPDFLTTSEPIKSSIPIPNKIKKVINSIPTTEESNAVDPGVWCAKKPNTIRNTNHNEDSIVIMEPTKHKINDGLTIK